MLAIVQNVAAGFGILNLSVFFLLTGPRQNNQGARSKGRNLILEYAGSTIG